MLTCFQFALQWTVPASLLSWWKDQKLASWSFSWNFNPKQEEYTWAIDACSKKRLAVVYPRWSTLGRQTSPVRSRLFPLPIFIKEDPAFWWQPVLCQFSSKKLPSWWQNLPLCEGLRPYAGGRPFVSSWFRLKVVRPLVCLLSKWFCSMKHSLDVVASMYLSF